MCDTQSWWFCLELFLPPMVKGRPWLGRWLTKSQPCSGGVTVPQLPASFLDLLSQGPVQEIASHLFLGRLPLRAGVRMSCRSGLQQSRSFPQCSLGGGGTPAPSGLRDPQGWKDERCCCTDGKGLCPRGGLPPDGLPWLHPCVVLYSDLTCPCRSCPGGGSS